MPGEATASLAVTVGHLAKPSSDRIRHCAAQAATGFHTRSRHDASLAHPTGWRKPSPRCTEQCALAPPTEMDPTVLVPRSSSVSSTPARRGPNAAAGARTAPGTVLHLWPSAFISSNSACARGGPPLQPHGEILARRELRCHHSAQSVGNRSCGPAQDRLDHWQVLGFDPAPRSLDPAGLVLEVAVHQPQRQRSSRRHSGPATPSNGSRGVPRTGRQSPRPSQRSAAWPVPQTFFPGDHPCAAPPANGSIMTSLL